MRTIATLAGTLLFVSATIASASSQFLVFGDSTVDAGNERVILGDAWNLEAYPEGQRTEGTTFAHKLGATFESGFNFGVGGSLAVENGDNRPDFAAQRQTFFGSGLDTSGVDKVIISFGGNDFRALLAAGLPTPEQVAATSAGIITEIITGIGQLSATGLTEFVVVGMPDISRFPAIAGTPFQSIIRGAVEGYDAGLTSSLDGFAGATGLDIDFFSAIGFADTIFDSPEEFGITQMGSACREEGGVIVECADPEGYFFYDSIHPTDAIHSLIASALLDQISPAEVPLPAGFPLLLSGLALFGLASRRHRSRA